MKEGAPKKTAKEFKGSGGKLPMYSLILDEEDSLEISQRLREMKGEVFVRRVYANAHILGALLDKIRDTKRGPVLLGDAYDED